MLPVVAGCWVNNGSWAGCRGAQRARDEEESELGWLLLPGRVCPASHRGQRVLVGLECPGWVPGTRGAPILSTWDAPVPRNRDVCPQSPGCPISCSWVVLVPIAQDAWSPVPGMSCCLQPGCPGPQRPGCRVSSVQDVLSPAARFSCPSQLGCPIPSTQDVPCPVARLSSSPVPGMPCPLQPGCSVPSTQDVLSPAPRMSCPPQPGCPVPCSQVVLSPKAGMSHPHSRDVPFPAPRSSHLLQQGCPGPQCLACPVPSAWDVLSPTAGLSWSPAPGMSGPQCLGCSCPQSPGCRLVSSTGMSHPQHPGCPVHRSRVVLVLRTQDVRSPVPGMSCPPPRGCVSRSGLGCFLPTSTEVFTGEAFAEAGRAQQLQRETRERGAGPWGQPSPVPTAVVTPRGSPAAMGSEAARASRVLGGTWGAPGSAGTTSGGHATAATLKREARGGCVPRSAHGGPGWGFLGCSLEPGCSARPRDAWTATGPCADAQGGTAMHVHARTRAHTRAHACPLRRQLSPCDLTNIYLLFVQRRGGPAERGAPWQGVLDTQAGRYPLRCDRLRGRRLGGGK